MSNAVNDRVLELRKVERRLSRQLPRLERATGPRSRRRLAEQLEQAEACLRDLERELRKT